jgi:phosphatidylinositol dimannoside acyltransferase
MNSRLVIGLGLVAARLVGPRVGYPASRLIADRVAKRRGLAWVRALRANQWVITGQCLTGRELDLAALAVLRHQAHCLFDLYHYRRDPAGLQALAPLTDQISALIERSRSRWGGALVVIPHLSNFDVAFIAQAHRGLQAQMLTLAQPSGGYRAQNRLRDMPGFDITSVNEESVRKAVTRLKEGGIVVTGIDRPVEGKTRELTFFGHSCYLPAGHIRMALAAKVPVIPAAVAMEPSGRYRLVVGEPIPMCPDGETVACIRGNAEAVLEVIADFIRKAPKQWLMYYPVWPQALDACPS